MPLAIALWGGLRPRRQRKIHRRILREFDRSVLLIQDRSALLSTFGARVRELLPIRSLVLFQLADSGELLPGYAFGVADELLDETRIDPRGRLVSWLRVNETPLEIPSSAEVVEYLDAPERQLLERLGAHLCLPLTTLHQLAGILLLTLEDPRRLPRGETMEVLELLAHQGALALENAALYEQQRLRLERLHRAERLAAAGQLAAGAAHEIRNPLTAIRSTLQYLTRETGDAESRQMIEELLEEADRIDRTVGELLRLTREGRFEPVLVDLVEILERSLNLVETQAERQKVVIHRQLGLRFMNIRGDPDLLRQLFLNLLLNALQAMPDGGELIVRGKRVEPVFGSPVETRVQLEIVDTGCGIPGEILERVFDPFFTTKSEGTGLGLAISHRIVERHQGELEIDSEPDRGTVVRLRFPEERWPES